MPGSSGRLKTARRVFGLVPVLVFLLTFILLAQQFNSPTNAEVNPTFYLFLDILLRSLAASLTSGVLCIGAYGFYRYLIERSPGL